MLLADESKRTFWLLVRLVVARLDHLPSEVDPLNNAVDALPDSLQDLFYHADPLDVAQDIVGRRTWQPELLTWYRSRSANEAPLDHTGVRTESAAFDPRQNDTRSLALLDLVRNRQLSESARGEAFDELLHLTSGFWQSRFADVPQTLHSFVVLQAGWMLSPKRPLLEEPEDIAVLVLMKLFAEPPAATEDLRRWLLATTRRFAIAALRKGQQHESVEDAAAVSVAPEQEFAVQFRELLRSLAPRTRQVFVMRTKGYSTSHVAMHLGLSERQVRIRFGHAWRILRNFLSNTKKPQ